MCYTQVYWTVINNTIQVKLTGFGSQWPLKGWSQLQPAIMGREQKTRKVGSF